MVDDETLLALATRNQETARCVAARLGIEALWRSIGAEPHLVGSLRTGLLMVHRDIDWHIYSNKVDIEQDFMIMGRLAAHPDVVSVQFSDGLNTDEQCLEWHCRAKDGEDMWSLDMIHMPKGARYDGYFERVVDRLSAVLTPETRTAILRLKYEIGGSVPGIAFCRAVICDGIRTPEAFVHWLKRNPVQGVMEWMP